MRKIKLPILITLISSLFIFGCKKKGCIDANADNYEMDAKKDDGSCTFPTISLNTAGDGDVNGVGGTASSTSDWENSQNRTELNMDITAASGGSMQVIVKDAEGTEVLNETLTVGTGDDSKSVCSSAGTSGTWSVTVKLTDFDGDGSFSLSQGC